MDPVTAAVILAGAGLGLTAYGQIEAGKSQEEQSEFNARMAENEAVMARQKARFEQKRHAAKASRIKGRLATLIAKSGARPDVGAPLVVAAEQAAELELENLLVGFEGEQLAKQRISQAGITRFGGKVAKRASRIQAGATLLQGFGQIGMMGGGKPGPGKPAGGGGPVYA